MSLFITPLFEKSQSAHSTDVADQIAPAGHNAFNWRQRSEPLDLRTTEQIKADAHKADMLARYYARKAKDKATRVNPQSDSGWSSGFALQAKEIRIELARAA